MNFRKMKTCRRIESIFLVLTVCLLTNKLTLCEPKLTIQPPNAFFEAKKQSFLMCTGKSTEGDDDEKAFTDMTWWDPNGDNLNVGKFEVKKVGGFLKLTFENPVIEDSGYYNCTATYQNTDKLEASKLVKFYEGITWEDCSTEQNVILGKKGFISCKPIGNPKPIISWEKDRSPVDTERLIIKPEGIEISDVRHDDEGIYIITASVLETGQEERQQISVRVYVPPRIIMLDKEFHAIEGNKYNIQCEATGSPKPVITWFDPQRRNLSTVEGFTVSAEGTLTIHTVTQDSRGTYTCYVQNAAGEDDQAMELYVLVKPAIEEFESITADEGTSAILHCSARGDPEPQLSIRRDNNPEPFSDNQEDKVILSTSRDVTNALTILKLEIKRVSRDDDGLYFCAANNSAGRVESVGHLTVHYPPDLSATQKKKAFAWPGHPGNLTCFVIANPNATISWRFRNEDLRENQIYKIHSTNAYSNLLVDVGDNTYDQDVFGVYSCIAKNTQGESTVNITLAQGRVPDVLSQVVFNKVTPTSITFDFMGVQQSEEDNVPVKAIVVEYWIERFKESSLKTHEWAIKTTYILDDLKPRTTYLLRFAAKNDVGVGDYLSSQYSMPQERAPDSPQFITKNETVSPYPDKFEIKWTIPNDNGEPIESFEIRYYKVDREIDGYKQISGDTNIVVTNWESPVYELTDLTPSTTYRVELRAVNKIGQSFYEKGLIFKTNTGEAGNGQTDRVPHSGLTIPVVIAIAVVAVLLLLVLLDVTSYLRFHCGLLYLMRYHTCGRSQSEKVKDVGLEDGKACAGRKTFSNGKNRMHGDDPFEDSPMM